MIDTWLIFTLFIPFMEVIFHTKMAMIRQRLNSLDLNSTKKSDGVQTAWGEEKLELIKKKDAETLKMSLFFSRGIDGKKFVLRL